MTQRVQEQIGVLPAVEAEFHLCKIGREMLCADSMPRANDAAFQKRKGILHGVGVDVPINVDLGLVLDRFVTVSHGNTLHGSRIGIEFVGHDYIHVCTDILLDELCQRPALNVISMKETQIAAALPDAQAGLSNPCLPRQNPLT